MLFLFCRSLVNSLNRHEECRFFFSQTLLSFDGLFSCLSTKLTFVTFVASRRRTVSERGLFLIDRPQLISELAWSSSSTFRRLKKMSAVVRFAKKDIDSFLPAICNCSRTQERMHYCTWRRDSTRPGRKVRYTFAETPSGSRGSSSKTPPLRFKDKRVRPTSVCPAALRRDEIQRRVSELDGTFERMRTDWWLVSRVCLLRGRDWDSAREIYAGNQNHMGNSTISFKQEAVQAVDVEVALRLVRWHPVPEHRASCNRDGVRVWTTKKRHAGTQSQGCEFPSSEKTPAAVWGRRRRRRQRGRRRRRDQGGKA